MTQVTMHDLFKVGAHFGHQRRVWNPQMHPYVYGERDKIHIIDLEKTAPLMNEALNFVSSVAARNGTVLFVGTKRVARSVIREQAERCGMPYVSHRWLGGMLTNFKTIKQSINRLKELESQKINGVFDKLTKKEELMRTREMAKLELNLSGIKDMDSMPDVVFVVDVKHENIAVKEAKSLPKKVNIIGVVDTNSSTDNVDYIIPANDDAGKAVAFYVTKVADAILEAHSDFGAQKDAVSETEAADSAVQETSEAYEDDNAVSAELPEQAAEVSSTDESAVDQSEVDAKEEA